MAKKSAARKAAEKKLRSVGLGIKIITALTVFVLLTVSVVFFESRINYALGLVTVDEKPVTGDESAEETAKRINSETLTVHFMDVGQGDAILLDFPVNEDDSPKLMLIDGTTDKEKQKAIDYLDSLYPALKGDDLYLEYVILTHPDEDHGGGLDDIITRYGAKTMFRPNVRSTRGDYSDPGMTASGAGKLVADGDKGLRTVDTLAYMRVIDAMYNQLLRIPDSSVIVNIPPKQAASAQREILVFDRDGDGGYDEGEDCLFTFWAPNRNYYSDVNNYSPIMTVDYQGKRMLLTGDCEAQGEADFVAAYKDGFEHCDVIKFGHHGSKTSTGEALLNAVTKQSLRAGVLGIVSCGFDNDYGHPHAAALNRWAKLGFSIDNVYRTDLSSTIVISVKFDTNDEKYVILCGTTKITNIDEKPVRWLYIAVAIFILVVFLLFVAGTDWKKEAKRAGKKAGRKR